MATITDDQPQFALDSIYVDKQGNYYEQLNWRKLREMGLLRRINEEILGPLGLVVLINTEDGTSSGAAVSPDGVWTYEDSTTTEGNLNDK